MLPVLLPVLRRGASYVFLLLLLGPATALSSATGKVGLSSSSKVGLREALLPRDGALTELAREIGELRRRKGDGEWDTRLDCLLEEMDSVSKNPFFRVLGRRTALSRLPSGRLRLHALSRVVEESMVGAASPMARRQALAVTLRALSNEDDKESVRSLLKKCLRARGAVTMKEMLLRTPAGLETPLYDVLQQSDQWEVRSYAEFSVVQVQGDAAKGPGAFGSLAGYILSGQNDSGEKLGMTTPVLMRKGDTGRSMAFVIPKKYESEPPKPLAESLQLAKREPQLTAALWFGGLASDEAQLDGLKTKLRSLIDADVGYEVKPDAAAFLAAYNDPFTPPWKRRNEILIEIMSSSTGSAVQARE